MARHIWNICQPSTSSHWTDWIKLYLTRKRSFWDLSIPNACSWTWRKLLKLRDLIRPLIKFTIGDGAHTWLWFDNWLPSGPILPSLGERVIYDSALPRDARVAEIIRDGQWLWPVANSNELLTLKEAIPQNMVPNPLRKDNIRWIPSHAGVFSAKSSWTAIRSHRPQVQWHKLVWYPQNIPRMSFILWLAIRHRLGTQDRLPNIPTPSCLLCGTQLDTHDHLFFACPTSWKIWIDLLSKCNTHWQPFSWSDAIHYMASNWKKNSLTNIIRKLTLSVSVYTIWAARNGRYHTNSWRDTVSIIRQIKDTIRCRITSLRRVKDCPINRNIQSI